MQAAILTKRLNDPGGSEISALQLGEYLDIPTTFYGFGTSQSIEQNTIIKQRNDVNTSFLPHKIEDLIQIWLDNQQFASDIRKQDPDIIFSDHSLSLIGSYLAARSSIPHVVFLHDLSMAPRSSITDRLSKGAYGLLLLLEDGISKYIYKHTTALIANSNYTKSAYKNAGVSSPISVMYPLIDPHKYVTESGCEILHVTPLHRKGIDVTLDLAERMPEEDFLVVGALKPDDDYLERIERLDNIRYKGYYDNMKLIYQQTKLVVMPSRAESFGRVPVEAGLSGIPTVAADTGGLPESVGISDCLVSDYDPAEYESTIRTVLRDYEYYSRKTREHARELSAPKQINRLRDILRKHLPSQFPVEDLFVREDTCIPSDRSVASQSGLEVSRN